MEHPVLVEMMEQMEPVVLQVRPVPQLHLVQLVRQVLVVRALLIKLVVLVLQMERLLSGKELKVK